MIKFLDLFNAMHCDFFEIQSKSGTFEHIDYELSGKMTDRAKKYYGKTVSRFYTVKGKRGNSVGLLIELAD